MNTKKKCSDCGEIKAGTDFNKNSRTPDGYRSECRECTQARVMAKHLADPKWVYKHGQEYKDAQREKGRVRARDYYRRNAERKAEQARTRRRKNPERYRAYMQAYYKTHIERMRAWAREYNQANREVISAKQRIYRKNRPCQERARKARREAAKIQATPAWANNEKMLAIYRLCRTVTEATGAPHQVDHIVPLRSPQVCGLHVEHNLQVIAAVFNREKSNLIWPDMP